jgi:BMFP domain-containing protein YqiC
MSQLSQTLFQAAEDIRLSSPTESAVEHLKQAGFTEKDARLSIAQHVMEKEACSALTEAGVDIEQAVSMVKAAGIHLKDLVSYEPEVEAAHPSVELLKQAAHYIDALEAQVESLKDDLEKSAQEQSTQSVALPEMFTKAASAGAFTNEDLVELQKMDQNVLTKIASAMDEPWSMGSGSGAVRKNTDPMLEWLMN